MTSKVIRLNDYESATIHNSLLNTIKEYEELFKELETNRERFIQLEPYMEWYIIEYNNAKKLLKKIGI